MQRFMISKVMKKTFLRFFTFSNQSSSLSSRVIFRSMVEKLPQECGLFLKLVYIYKPLSLSFFLIPAH